MAQLNFSAQNAGGCESQRAWLIWSIYGRDRRLQIKMSVTTVATLNAEGG